MPRKPKRHELQQRGYRIKNGLECAPKPRLILPERHLFVTEGTKTEPYYLEGLVNLICERYGTQAKKQFNIIGEGDNTLNLLQKAESYQQNESDGYQHIWLIYDKDDFPPDAFDNTMSRCNAINKQFEDEQRDTKFHAIWSNQCFELWFILHFDYLQSDIEREQYRDILSTHIGRHYEKNDSTIFATLYPNLNTALKNAKRLMNTYPMECPPSQKAPATNFYELIEHLGEYLK